MKNPRELAVLAVLEIQNGGYSNLILKKMLAQNDVSKEEKNFLTRIFYGTIERKITIDFVLKSLTLNKFKKLDKEVLAILETGCYQILYMSSVPDFAAVSESVKLCKRFKKSSASSFVNAILRKVVAFDRSVLNKTTTLEQRAVNYSVNVELQKLLETQYPENFGNILESFFNQKPIYLSVNTLKTDIKSVMTGLLEQNIKTENTEIPHFLKVVEGNIFESEYILSGEIRIQSIAAGSAVIALDPKPGQIMLDLCAAPGGKALTSAYRMEGKGKIVAFDRSLTRLKLIEQAALTSGVDIIETRHFDTGVFMPEFEGKADRVLCDVPCSGFGEIATKPELRLKQPEEQQSELFLIQNNIISNALRYVKVGGRVVYSTCTIDKRENEDIIEYVLKNFNDFKIVNPLENIFKKQVTEQNCIKFLPGDGFFEGFFVATFERMC